ncbi:MAG: hypothetical protein JXA42_05485, partial [Anaerolineales bacterium]|nr:hypothetical protein [Anaerolineales bacterium]
MSERQVLVLVGCILMILVCLLAISVVAFLVAVKWLIEQNLFGPDIQTVQMLPASYACLRRSNSARNLFSCSAAAFSI